MNKGLTKNTAQTIYGYEERRKRVLAKQVQWILGREKQLNLTSAVAQSFSQ